MIKIKNEIEKMDELKNDILNSDEYCDIAEKIEKLENELKKLAEPLVKQIDLVRNLEKDILIECKEQGLSEYDGYEVKFKKTKKVDNKKLFGVLNNDVDSFVGLATITQKALKDYAKEHKDLKGSLNGCIEVIKCDPVALIIE